MSENESRKDFLVNLINERARGLHSSTAWFRRRYYVSTISVVILSALITVLAGTKFIQEDWSNSLVLILSATVTVVSAWGVFFSPKESWFLTAEVLHKIRALQTRLDFELKSSHVKNDLEKLLESS